MEKKLFRIAQMLSLCIVFAASSASAQDRPISVHVPFEFVAMQKVFSAGDFTVTPNLSDSTLLIRSVDHKQVMFVLTHSVQSPRNQEVPKLVFNRYGERYFLSEVWSDGTNVGRALTIPPAEGTVSTRGSLNKVEILAYRPGKGVR
jgi:hypothetical protein